MNPNTKKNKVSCVFDASAIIAALDGEKCDISNLPVLMQSCGVTQANIAEVVNYMIVKRQKNHHATFAHINELFPNRFDITDDLNEIATGLTELGHKYGLSLGDKYCLALAKLAHIPVYTADRIWKQLEKTTKIEIILIR